MTTTSPEPTTVNPTDVLDQLTAAANAATRPSTWHWAGNTDLGEPYLAAWVPGAGRASILAIGTEERDPHGEKARQLRSSAEEFEYDPDEVVADWAYDRCGDPISDPQLWFYTDLEADPARSRAIFEVAPHATSRTDRAVYRADIIGIRHPDAQYIVTAARALPGVTDAVRRVLNRHTVNEDGHCVACQAAYPCPDVQDITDALAAVTL